MVNTSQMPLLTTHTKSGGEKKSEPSELVGRLYSRTACPIRSAARSDGVRSTTPSGRHPLSAARSAVRRPIEPPTVRRPIGPPTVRRPIEPPTVRRPSSVGRERWAVRRPL